MDIDTATQRARAYLEQQLPPETPEVAIDGRKVLERDWSYTFFWNSAEYLRTGDDMSQLWGNAPVVVPKDGSDAFTLGTHRPTDVLLDDYEQQHGIPHGGQRERALGRTGGGSAGPRLASRVDERDGRPGPDRRAQREW
ncbi:MAG: hypothetical protein GEV07_27635 [Streptosporangiales bacterium]|nr:hypothetical protein [Streptosporangiales bacterium]